MTPLFTRVQIRSVFRFVQLWVNAFTRWCKRVRAYLGNLICIHLFLRINFCPDWSKSPYSVWANQTNTNKYLQGFAIYQSKFAYNVNGFNWRPNLSFNHLKMIKSCSFTSFLSHFFHVFIVNNWEKCPGGGVLVRFYRPGGGGLNCFFARGVGNSPIKKIALGGGVSGLELTDTLLVILGKGSMFDLR